MNYLEIEIKLKPIDPWKDLINSDLGELNFESFLDTENGVKAFVRKDLFKKQSFESLLEEYKSNCKISFSTKEVKTANWNEEWEKNFNPIEINENCIVRASFHQLSKKYEYDILVNPKMSFGTGHHATTFLMMNALLKMNLSGKEVLDMGCGTSVLAILASKLGAKHIMAVDIDSWSVNNSIENISLNKVDNIIVKEGSAELLKNLKFNLILANINLNILLNQIEIYANCLTKSGDILFSGVLEQDSEKLKSKAEECNLQIINQQQKDKWILLHCRKM